MARHFLKDALLYDAPDGKPAPVRLQFLDPPIFNPDFVENIINELSRKEWQVQVGLDEFTEDKFTEVEKLVFRLLYESGVLAGRLPEIHTKKVP